MTKILQLFLGHEPDDHAKSDAFAIGLSRLVDSRPRLGREALADPNFLTLPDPDSASNDWDNAEDDLGTAVETNRPR